MHAKCLCSEVWSIASASLLPAQVCIGSTMFCQLLFMQRLLDERLRLQERVQEAASGSPSQAKFRKGLETALDSPLQAKGSPLKSGTSVGTPKRAGSGFGDKVPRMTCWGTSDQPVVVKKPSLAERYSAWKVSRPLHCMSTINHVYCTMFVHLIEDQLEA